MFSKRSVDPAPDTAELVSRYAERFHAGALTEHGVASALGLWLLLALLAPAAEGDARTELEEHLGCGADDASRRARLLLAAPHPAVRAAVAVWANPAFVNDDQRRWQEPLAGDVETGPIPTQAAADGWAAQRTDGMIETFPITIGPDTATVLASALATDVAWTVPFADVAPHLLGGPFGDRITTALEAPPIHTQLLVDTTAAGVVAVHVAGASSGLDVVSVLAGHHVERDAVLAATLEVGRHLDAVRRGFHGRVDVFALPLGEGAAWSIEERQVERYDASGDRHTVFHTYLAAWSAQSDHDLSAAPGIAAAFTALDGFLVDDLRPGLFEARQTALAEYRRDGFRAAAVTAIGVRAGQRGAGAETRHPTRRHGAVQPALRRPGRGRRPQRRPRAAVGAGRGGRAVVGRHAGVRRLGHHPRQHHLAGATLTHPPTTVVADVSWANVNRHDGAAAGRAGRPRR